MKPMTILPLRPRTGFLLVLAVALGVELGVLLERRVLAVESRAVQASTAIVPNFRLVAEAWSVIDRVYVDRRAVQSRPLTYGAISGMVSALGDTGHSGFIPPAMVQRVHDLNRAEFRGVGAEVQMKDNHVVVVAPIDGSPAQRAGLQPGDIIMRVDGQDIAGLSLEQVVGRISGEVGTTVTLSLLSPVTGRIRAVTIERAEIKVPNVKWRHLPGTTVAQVRITSFSKGVTENLRQALKDVQAQGLKGIVLDLRSNPGGLLGEAVGVASQFLAKGNVLLVRNAKGLVAPIAVESGGQAPDLPVAVLVNDGTASGAEIVAGALQDAHRATVIGVKTFGTGTVLSEFRLSDGSALMLAIEEWLTPNGHTIWHQGISPDTVLALPAGASPLFPEDAARLSPAQLRASTDVQLLSALTVLGH